LAKGTVTDAATPAVPAIVPVAEAEARAIVEGLFRERGLRVLRDVEVSMHAGALVVDGYDPQKMLGFEYADPLELAHLPRAKPARDPKNSAVHILWLEPAEAEVVRAQAIEFLDLHAARDKP